MDDLSEEAIPSIRHADEEAMTRERAGFWVLGPITKRMLKEVEEGNSTWDSDQEEDAERSMGLDVHLTRKIPRPRSPGR